MTEVFKSTPCPFCGYEDDAPEEYPLKCVQCGATGEVTHWRELPEPPERIEP